MLTTLSQFFQKSFRESDDNASYGGEEFIIILREAEEAETIERAETLREGVKKFLLNLEIKI